MSNMAQEEHVFLLTFYHPRKSRGVASGMHAMCETWLEFIEKCRRPDGFRHIRCSNKTMSCLVPGEALSLERSVKTNCLIRFQVQQHCHVVFYLQKIKMAQKYGLQYQTILNFQPPLPLNGNLRNTSYMKKIPNYEF